jgi:IstB-like ATP binding protein
MERTEVLELMATLKLYGMRAAGACPRAGRRPVPGDEVMTNGIKRRHEPPRIVGDLLAAEIAEKQARSIKYQLTIAKLPLAKDIEDFDFTCGLNEPALAGGVRVIVHAFLARAGSRA